MQGSQRYLSPFETHLNCIATTGLYNLSPLYLTCTKGVTTHVYLRNSFTKKEDETEDEEQHNYDHGHVNDHGEQGEEEDDQLGDLYLRREPGRKLGNLYN